MQLKELDANARRILIDAQQTYERYLEAGARVRQHDGGMRWKRTGDREYLFRTRGGRGYGKSLGVRSPGTEAIYERFHRNKRESRQRRLDLIEELRRQGRFCVAAGVARVPATAANVVRVLDEAGLMGHGLHVLGTHALYAYESAAGALVDQALMTTTDIDLLFDAAARLRMTGAVSRGGLIDLLRKADKTFEVVSDGHFRAANRKGFLVELVKPLSRPEMRAERRQIGDAPGDLVAAEMSGFDWLRSSPPFVQIAIAEDGFPVRLHVPDPRFFALNKLWVSQEPSRDPVKRPRDHQQAQIAAHLAQDYLGLSFSDRALRVFPEQARRMMSEALGKKTPSAALPPGI